MKKVEDHVFVFAEAIEEDLQQRANELTMIIRGMAALPIDTMTLSALLLLVKIRKRTSERFGERYPAIDHYTDVVADKMVAQHAEAVKRSREEAEKEDGQASPTTDPEASDAPPKDGDNNGGGEPGPVVH